MTGRLCQILTGFESQNFPKFDMVLPQTHTYAHAHKRTHTFTHTRTHRYTHSHTHTDTHLHLYTQLQTFTDVKQRLQIFSTFIRNDECLSCIFVGLGNGSTDVEAGQYTQHDMCSEEANTRGMLELNH